MKFDYQARNQTGEIKTGIINASNRDSAFDILKKRDLYVTYLEKHKVPIYGKKISLFFGIRKKEVVLFSRQLAIMFKSRVPLVDTLNSLAKQTNNEKFQKIILKIAEDIKGGSTISDAFGKYPKLFSSFYVNMIKAGEASGKLDEIFNYLADYLERSNKIRGKIITAFIYPVFVLFVFTLVLILIVVYIIPQLSEVLMGTDQELPFITQVVMAFSNFMRYWGWALLILFIGFIFSFWYLLKKPRFKNKFDEIILKVPFLNILLKKIYLTQFALNLSTLLSGGLLLTQSLKITRDIVGNYVYKNIINKTREEVRSGENMSSVLQNYPSEISPLFIQMVAVGEKTGTLGTSLQNVVNFYQEEVDSSLDTAIKLIEPILILLLAVIVGTLVAAVLIPIYTVSMGDL